MIDYASSLLAVGGARTGIAPVNLLDVQDVNGNFYFWSDRRIVAPFAISASNAAPPGVTPPDPPTAGQQIAWLPPTGVVASSGSYIAATATLSMGTLICSYSWIFTTGGSITWDWGLAVLPTLPPGAVIDKAILTASVTYAGSVPTGTSAFPIQIDLSHLGSTIFQATMNATTPIGAMSASMTIFYPMIAIYYHYASGGGRRHALPGQRRA